MPLDDTERRVLEETERSLAEHDPGFARRFRTGWPGRARRWGIAVTATALVLVVGLLWLGLVGQAFLITLLAAAVVGLTGWWPSQQVAALLHRDERPDGRR